MKYIFLVQEFITHYRVPIFNLLEKYLFEKDLKLIIITNHIDENASTETEFDYVIVDKFSYGPFYFLDYREEINKYQPSIIIQTGELKVLNVYWLLLISKFKKIKTILWTHGYRKGKPNVIFKFLMSRADATILYTPYIELKKPFKKNKTFYANNSLYFSDYQLKKKETLLKNAQAIKKKLKLDGKFVGLFCGRLYKEKRVNEIIEVFKTLDAKEYHLVVIGDGPEYQTLTEKAENENISNISFLGEITDFEEKSRYFAISDVGYLTGVIGLNVVDYFFWELPLIGLKGEHSPEVYYVKNNANGFLCNSIGDMVKKTIELKSNQELQNRLSEQAKKTYYEEANHEIMLQGFKNAIDYLSMD